MFPPKQPKFLAERCLIYANYIRSPSAEKHTNPNDKLKRMELQFYCFTFIEMERRKYIEKKVGQNFLSEYSNKNKRKFQLQLYN